MRWNVKLLESIFRPPLCERWVFANPIYPVNLTEDVLVVIKTGYGTKERAAAWFESLGNASEFRDFLVIADFASNEGDHLVYRGQELPVYDMVDKTVHHTQGLTQLSHQRAQKYHQLQRAIAAGDKEIALKLSKASGWELDALKFMSGLEFAYEKFPNKTWYILADDDTYLVQPSLKPLLGHLDPSKPHYLGNVVGDFRVRFAHGGSAIILSQAAIQAMLVENRKTLQKAHAESLSEVWGDRLLARALIRVGIYLNEDYSHLFNGESPRESKIRADRFCSPVVAFHTLATSAKMLDTGEHFGNITQPVLWIDLWDIYKAPALWRETEGVVGIHNQNSDHVGAPGQAVRTVEGVASAGECAKKCNLRYARTCLAWTWEAGPKRCHMSSWMIVGEKADGKVSGLNSQRVKRLEMSCLGY